MKDTANVNIQPYIDNFIDEMKSIESTEVFEVGIDIDNIHKRINELNELNSKAKNIYEKASIKALLDNYNKIIDKTINNRITLCWGIKNNKLFQYPVNIVISSIYKEDTSESIIADNNRSIAMIDFTQLYKAVAFEMMHRDLGYSLVEIDELIEVGGVLPFDVYKLLNIANSTILEDVSKFKIESSTYIDGDKNIHDFMHTSKFKLDNISLISKKIERMRYKTIVDFSLKQIMTVYLSNMLRINKYQFDIISITSKGVMIMYDSNLDMNIAKINIKLFGRQFIVSPIVEII